MLAYARGDVPDYQLAAFCMAVYFQGLSSAETFALTDAMVRSGETIDLGGALGRRVVDKHSTGGVGDKTTLAVGPIVAACGVPFGKMSGRGLGHTGGTLDKLEAIPGFRVELTTEEFIAQVREVGLAIVGQTGESRSGGQEALRAARRHRDGRQRLADRGEHHVEEDRRGRGRDRARREGRRRRVHEDAGGRAGARRDDDRARAARAAATSSACSPTWTSRSGARSGTRSRCARRRDTVRGNGPPDFTELVLDASAHLLALSDLGIDAAEARRRAEAAVADGSAYAAYERWVRAQGGDPDEAALPKAPLVREVFAPRAGYVQRLAALPIGLAALHLGAGRREKDDAIDHAVGVVCRKKRGDAVEEGEPLAEIHAARRGGRGRGGGRRARGVRARRRAAARAADRARHDR